MPNPTNPVSAVYFNAVLNVEIRHISGPMINDGTHVLNWIVADGPGLLGYFAAFEFDVCATHGDPDECDYACTGPGQTAVYRATIMGASPE